MYKKGLVRNKGLILLIVLIYFNYEVKVNSHRYASENSVVHGPSLTFRLSGDELS